MNPTIHFVLDVPYGVADGQRWESMTLVARFHLNHEAKAAAPAKRNCSGLFRNPVPKRSVSATRAIDRLQRCTD